MVVDKKGNLYTWGNNQFGQLGNGKASIFGMIYDNDDNDDEGYFSFLQDNSVINPTIIANLFVN
jgi:alpha-tubulin suppressor-like RCC1 family protein